MSIETDFHDPVTYKYSHKFEILMRQPRYLSEVVLLYEVL